MDPAGEKRPRGRPPGKKVGSRPPGAPKLGRPRKDAGTRAGEPGKGMNSLILCYYVTHKHFHREWQ
jgi:hypothetical protein